MASSDNEVPQPIIVKKIKKGGGGHHGGAWKVAYADFVTAMMAFFLLMWLLNVTTEEQKNAISNYFDPTHPRVSSELSGSGGILGGLTMSPDGAQVSNVQDIATPTTPTTPRSGMAMGDKRDQLGQSQYEGDTFDPDVDGNQASDTDKTSSVEKNGNNMQDGLNIFQEVENIDAADLEKLTAVVEAAQNEEFEDIKQKIYEEVQKTPELADLMDHLMIDITPEGLRIQIIDKEGRSMFPVGKANMYDFMQKLVEEVTKVIIPQPNQISVRGHTDSKPYPKGAAYNNWNLSSDRALASQRAIIDGGLPLERVENVIGKADREHLLPEDPLSARNRRISVILLRQQLQNATEIKKAAADAIKKRDEKIKAKALQSEDRENIPQLDQTSDGSTSFTIENDVDQPPLTNAVERFDINTGDEEDTDNPVGDEIRRLQQQKERAQQRRQVPFSAPTSQPTINDGQVLDFP